MKITFRERWGELSALISRCMEEMGRPCKLDRSRYLAFEDAGSFFTVGFEVDGKLVGFCCVYVHLSMLDQELEAQDHLFYLLPEHRKGWNALVMLREVENECRARGVKSLLLTATTFQTEGILSGRGYGKTASSFEKKFGPTALPQPKEAVA